MPDLAAWMASHAELEWGWGTVDCCLALADWAVENGHADPASAWRGTYSTELDWRRIVTGRGGLLSLVSDICARADLAPTDSAALGVIAVIGSGRHPERQWGAIFDGVHWRVRGQDGFSILMAQPLGMWSV